MKSRGLLVLICAILVSISNASDTFTSLSSIKQLFYKEGLTVKTIEEMLNSQQLESNPFMKSLHESLRENQQLKDEDLEVHLHHPTSTFLLIKGWYLARKNLQSLIDVNALETKIGLALPDLDDYTGSATAIIRIQKTHRISTDHMRIGLVNGKQGRPIDDENDMVVMATQAMALRCPGLALKWLDGIKKKSLSVVKLKIEIMEKIHEKLGCSGDAEEIERCVKQRDFEWLSDDRPTTIKYQELCRGDMIVEESKKSLLYCRYAKGRDIPLPIYKEEVHNVDPHVAIFYDVISDAEADHIIRHAFPGMFRGLVGNSTLRQSSDQRISKVGWLFDNVDTLIKKLSARIGDVTGLNTVYTPVRSPVEAMQVVNYGIGGQYEPHLDFYEDPEMLKNVNPSLQDTGDRISTFLFYLSRVHLGGATVFPKLNVRVPPVKNGAAFWYNARPNGEHDKRTLHAGCPVVLGEKWVANKWIRERGQEFYRPCPLDKEAIDG
ncbi:hypothetical protein CAPTEDRAFT_153364 [Capitella teleta]|uniref:procollagen-proline 4-dioxygenase n=1 Tax=Capitella teleta TaxID=283909 RepID=R7UR81_CAPTE|nr:hypothetical protein CAPTEDRAFT_153364 [Capitella teleta]|eukprot:ELU05926.1 hypothetical protein CAPTEDRAFT_153364 [Capitella teleta]